jgi:hypothetical protein
MRGNRTLHSHSTWLAARQSPLLAQARQSLYSGSGRRSNPIAARPAGNIPRLGRLADADASATAHSRLCGSTVTVDLKMEGDLL